MAPPGDTDGLVAMLAAAGCVAADDEARELRARAGGHAAVLEALVARRTAGEPLAWIVGSASFCGLTIRVDAGVYVPRWQTEPLAERAAARLPEGGVGVDVCTGSGAVAAVLAARRPHARVLGTDLSDAAVACAGANGVAALVGDLLAPVPPELDGRVDVVVGVTPYVPTPALRLLPRDTFAYESPLAYDGGENGTVALKRVVEGAPRLLRPGGALLLELGGEQVDAVAGDLGRAGYVDVTTIEDADGDVRGIEATLGARGRR